jgi:23S rRNA (uracil1939-C5)-methyltransferase
MSIIEEGQCRIKSLNSKGLGVGSTDLGEVVLPYTLIGELVAFERHVYRGKSNCILTKIIEPSPERQIPRCKYFTSCGGCLLQHLPINDYNDFKYKLAYEQIASKNLETIINPIITIPPSNRRRANLEVLKKNEQIFLGFHRFRSHQIININECPALLPQLSDLIVPLKELFDQILEHRQKAQIFITNCDNGVDITITIQEQQFLRAEQRDILLEFAEKYNITRLLFRYRKSLDIIQEIEKPYIVFGNVAV